MSRRGVKFQHASSAPLLSASPLSLVASFPIAFPLLSPRHHSPAAPFLPSSLVIVVVAFQFFSLSCLFVLIPTRSKHDCMSAF